MIGFASIELERLDEAEELIKQSQGLWLALGDSVYADFCNLNLARITWKRGDLEMAWNQYKDTVAALGEWNDRRGLAYAVEGLGRVAGDLENYSQSVQLLGAAQRLRESIGLQRDFADERVFARAVKAGCQALGPSYDFEWQAGYNIPPTRVLHWVKQLSR
jgi:tetratricopeptide (TPR) repeat protein